MSLTIRTPGEGDFCKCGWTYQAGVCPVCGSRKDGRPKAPIREATLRKLVAADLGLSVQEVGPDEMAVWLEIREQRVKTANA